MIGKTLGHYQITSQLGKGGMGEVYQAKDQVLGRDVAVKILPDAFARDADRVARFQREAKLLASLNHPNIATIHGLEESSGKQFLVMELVEGETLADRIKGGPIPVEESLKLAFQIAEALEAAHEKGVIHRDLKPANVKITPDGKVKVLDFGLAKAFAGEQTELNLSNSPTLSNAATQQGVILGTAAYMSPEQAKEKAVDKRADVWAFGCVVFEMLTGRSLFSAEDVSQTLARVLEREPDFSSLPPNLHPTIAEMLGRCLDKDVRSRYNGISDARVDIQKALADRGGIFSQPAKTIEARRKLRTVLPWIAATAVLAAIIAGIAVWKLKPSESRQVMRFDYEIPEDQKSSSYDFLMLHLAASPDGRQFAYSTSKGIYLRRVDALTAKLIPGSEGDTSHPFFSPDGKWIGYRSRSDGKLKKIVIDGGAPIILCDATILSGASWHEDNTIVFGPADGAIMRVSGNGGIPQAIIKAKSGTPIYPQILPGGATVLYTAYVASPPTRFTAVVYSLESGKSKELFSGGQARYLPTGHIIFRLPNDNNLYAVPFDLDKLEAKGGPVPIVEAVSGNGRQFAVSDSGTLVYIAGPANAAASRRRLVWVDQRGEEEPISAALNNYRSPRISPDGTRVALTIASEKSDIWIWDIGRETLTRLTFNEKSRMPLWTLDGTRIVFLTTIDNKPVICRKAADGTGEDEILGSVSESRYSVPYSWAIDGKTLITVDVLKEGTQGIGAISLEGGFKWRSLLADKKYWQTVPEVSPDGRWMAYHSTESGRAEVYVRPFSEVQKGRWQVSVEGGTYPLWAPNGQKLFYRIGDAVLTVGFGTDPAFKPGKPETLFRGDYATIRLDDGHPWDISPDGKRLLMMKQGESTASAAPAPRKINIVLNWFEELKQRVPVK